MKAVKYAAAKINLLLDVTEKLKNGYHSIFSVMQSIALYDKITVTKNDAGKIRLSCSDKSVPTDEKNTAFKAAMLFFDEIHSDDRGIDIEIEKNIPQMAGLAGGSADAAGVLLALNDLYKTNLSEETLIKLAGRVGADVPFCLKGGLMLALDTGLILAPLPRLPEYHLVLVKPNEGVSTAEAYGAIDKKDWIRHPNKELALKALVDGDIHEFFSYSANVFEQVIDAGARVEIKSVMRAHNCLYASMTGSGSAVFGVFMDKKDAEDCFSQLKNSSWQVFLTKPVSKGVLSEGELE
ncbi:MAG: 4-(cytidine 5'-diphospho)-2-C-methyl-D-erythritol kinase [Clostridiales bacterium]|jgi:4-diphosphocytidyl-2-C-methyl-D-erythritol kinase|nr:4-(cytidine 5'-diphospho)-2-C-methyl-D-erythritol kinase [Clostridiales bacterium]HOA33160.1 4-(cytidine 5'-diphospho)-2-C-methyl-D-erythritol kinase [Clostridiales bacterium]HOL79122.1 4-(cytidine 5'-diphospho)-2-C-methyl-D-erythritol kinase [Clostridiales bacterium]HQA05767.1 4-(cytidine 5'-diphospho)-2-C-methyl-D-erythritol kinase [Clostridiales bacterium]HQD73388.1 4-(cytidine 5'-diphospho)-2-C-methyl-D-erythritol kinase [Clostridiales bacterium]